jgi:hypothetical protein
MRGSFSLFTSETIPAKYRSGLFIVSAELDVVCKVYPALLKRWPEVRFTTLAPRGYANEFSCEKEILWLEDLKVRPLRSLLALRRRRFDLCVVLFAGRPTFRKLKLSSFLLNAGRIVFYNENGGSIVIDRQHWGQLLAHLAHRTARLHPSAFFFPCGFLYLLMRTLWLIMRAKLVGRKPRGIS